MRRRTFMFATRSESIGRHRMRGPSGRSFVAEVLDWVVEWAAFHRPELMEDWNLAGLRRTEAIRRWRTDLKERCCVKTTGRISPFSRFEWTEGSVDLPGASPFRGVFEPLRDTAVVCPGRVDTT